MNSFILKTISIALLCSVAAGCNDKDGGAGPGLVKSERPKTGMENPQPEQNAQALKRQNAQALKEENVPAPQGPVPVPALPEQVAGSGNIAACSSPELDDAAALAAVLKNPALPVKFPPLLPVPVFGELPAMDALTLTSSTKIVADSADGRVNLAANYLQAALKTSTGYAMPVDPSAAQSPCIRLEIRKLKGADGKELGEEAYSLVSGKNGVVIRSSGSRGLFNGIQTLLQLLPPKVYSKRVQTAPWTVPAVRIVDWPRFRYRGTMLDVARTFFTVDQVKRYIDQIALLKINILHLHLTDDQGWRIAVDEYPALTQLGASAQVNTPIICLTGDDNIARTKAYLKTVISSIAALTPGPYIHIGSDETAAGKDQMSIYTATAAAAAPGKTLVAWNELATRTIPAGTVLQYWDATMKNLPEAEDGLKMGARFVLSPARHAYLDFKYHNDPKDYGHSWTTGTSLEDSYRWEPTEYLKRADGTFVLGEADVLGVSTALWTEYARAGNLPAYSQKKTDLPPMVYAEYMTFPRLASIAEIGWSPKSSHSWDDYKVRLGYQGARWEAFGIGYFRSPDIQWKTPSDVLLLNR